MASNLEIALEYLARLARFDADGALGMVADDAQFMDPDGSRVSKDDVRARFSGIGELFDGPFEQKIVGTTTEGSRVAVEAVSEANLKNGKIYENIYHFLFIIENERIVEFREYCNTKAVEVFH